MKRLAVRNDSGGRGVYQARRGAKAHTGTDYSVTPGEPVYSPCSGQVKRIARCYSDTPQYTGVVVQGATVRLKVLYVRPTVQVGEHVGRGSQIGIAQDISQRIGKDGLYKNQGITPHIHIEVEHMDIEVLLPILELLEKNND
jgi:murein DD-endopeptidase MepM/ murein hydrolase activator NlpD